MSLKHAIRFLSAAVALTIALAFAADVGMAADAVRVSGGGRLEPIVIGTPDRLEVQPPEVRLDAARSRMRLIITGLYSDARSQDLTSVAEMTSSNPQVAAIEHGVVIPIGDGSAEICVTVGDRQQTVPVRVSNLGAADPVSFHNETLAVLTRLGCNSGACHGSPSGKGGFRLSLAAYDAVLDQQTLVRESYGRRTNVLDPDASLLLLKPTMQVSHGGGLKLRKSDGAYDTIRMWISEGCETEIVASRECVRFELLPGSTRTLRFPAHTQQLLALAHYSDGTVRDVTELAKFTSSDEVIASVQPSGLVVGHTRGEAAVMVRYLQHVESALFTFVRDVPGFAWSNPPELNYVDTHVNRKLQQLQYLPSEVCSDAVFIRRVYLDVIGQLPSVDEVIAFLNDTAADKRSRVVEALLNRPEYATYWALHWGDLLRLKEKTITVSGVHKFYSWLVDALGNNLPFNEFAHQLLTANGSTYTNPTANFYRTLNDVNLCTESTAQLFLGVRIQCAKCHNHPFERWTQDNYYGLSAFFNRVERKEGAREGEQVVWMNRAGEVTQPRTGKQMKPWLPTRGDVTDLPGLDRRQVFADWLVGDDNPFFAKVAVNRIWAHVMGRGIVEPVDDFRDSNPPANAELLEALADEFRSSGYDQKQILRTILNSRTYQLSAHVNEFNRDDGKYFSHARARMLDAEQMLDAICHVTGVPEKFAGFPEGTKASQLPSPDVDHEFLKLFGQPQRDTACACERSSESNLSQALNLLSGALIHDKLKHPDSRFRRLVAEERAMEDVIQELYLAAFCRRPNDEEIATAKDYVAGKEDRQLAWEDLCWSLLNADEFIFQH